MSMTFDFIGLGIGPFHLSLAALSRKVSDLKAVFLDQKPEFQWHRELMFGDAEMQTSWLKDLVTPVDPTNPCSFLNYLVECGLYYSFMNTGRRVITRREFEQYCQWVANRLQESLRFNSHVKAVEFEKDKFVVKTNQEVYLTRNISVATGLTPRIPEIAKEYIGPHVFHAKSQELQTMDLKEKRVLIVGGGQTGIEIFRNALKGKWGRMKSLRLISRRNNLEPLDESPFTNEYFTPEYVNEFFPLRSTTKETIVASQKLASDGNTPKYLQSLYEDLYQLRHVERDPLDFKILPSRKFVGLSRENDGYVALIESTFGDFKERLDADVIILSTGFCASIPAFLDPMKHLLTFDEGNRFLIKRNFDLDWKGPEGNKIYALNFSRHQHGISEPQTSLMAWRSATILNDLKRKDVYQLNHEAPSFIQYGKTEV